MLLCVRRKSLPFTMRLCVNVSGYFSSSRHKRLWMMTALKKSECLKAYALLEDDHPQEECGVIGVFAPNEDVARMAFFGLFALQHRGQEAAGIAVSNGSFIRMHKDVGLVTQVFTPAH